MMRTVEQIQNEIAVILRKIQELRRAQRQAHGAEMNPTSRRIYRLAAHLDALYAEKRSAQVSPRTPGTPAAPHGEPGKAESNTQGSVAVRPGRPTVAVPKPGHAS